MKRMFAVLLFALCSLSPTESRAQFTVLHNFFSAPYDGQNPWGDLTISGKTLFGMTSEGGLSHTFNAGCIFSIDTDGNNYKILLDFNDTNGGYPLGSLTFSKGKLYGMTSNGGVKGYGSIFSIDTDGNNFKNLLYFNDTNGNTPHGSLILIRNRLYGTTEAGGAYDSGCIFSIDTSVSHYIKLLDFNKTTGAFPANSLIFSGSRLYGMTVRGGNYDSGCIFSIDTDGSHYKILFNNFNSTNGGLPNSSLTLSGKALYGMTQVGGAYKFGCIFSIDTNGNNYKKLLSFDDTNGYLPSGSLTLFGSTLYGMTPGRAPLINGNLFSIDTDGSKFKVMYIFNSVNANSGSNPWGSPTYASGVLYGMTYYGGIYHNGIIFKMDTNAIAGVDNVTVNKGKISVYPNPSNGNVTVQVNIGQPENVEFTLYNLLGEPVYSDMENEPTGTINKHISLSSLPNGEYILQVIADGNVYHTKITKLQ